ncbi:hypothetical protein GN264_17320 [Escherichia coli]|nr:hypothetical protein [Escherichia coli]
MDKNNQLARIIGLLNEHGYEINDREIDETNAFEAVELVLAQLVDAHTALDATAEAAKPKEVIIHGLGRKPGNGKSVPFDMPVPADVLEKLIPTDSPYTVDMSGIIKEQLITRARYNKAEAEEVASGEDSALDAQLAQIALTVLTAPDDVPRPVMDGICDKADGGVDAQGIWDLCKMAILKGQ